MKRELKQKYNLSNRLYSRLLVGVANTNNIRVTEAKKLLMAMPKEHLHNLVVEVKEADEMPMSIYQIRRRLDDLAYEASKRGLVLTREVRNKKHMLVLEGVADITVWLYARQDEFKVFECGRCRLTSDLISEIVEDLESAAW